MPCDIGGGWSDLHIDLHGLILARLDVVSFLRCRSVCASWCQSVLINRYRCLDSKQSKVLPWLLLSSSPGALSRNFFSLYDHKTYEFRYDFPLHGRHRRQCVAGSSSGYLIDIDENLNLHATNPLTGSHIPLPPASTLHYLDPDENIRHLNPLTRYYKKLVLVGSAHVAAILYGCGRAAFARFGDDSWTMAPESISDSGYVSDLVFHKGRLYCVLGNYPWSLTVLDLACSPSSDPAGVRSTSAAGPSIDTTINDRFTCNWKYLVESPDGDRLFLVIKGDSTRLYPRYKSFRTTRNTRLKVFELDRDANEWYELTSLGDLTLLLGSRCNSVSLLVDDESSSELQKNSVYLLGTSRVDRYDMEDGCIKSLSPDSSLARLDLSPEPCWFTPSLS